ncbi:MAG: hypothetical protein M3Y54_09480 [Bacteroidota bacterium]|nr:hypothetical protein [Bacteroidota bacterium]
MARIELEMLVHAPPTACYALALNVQAHLESTSQTGERLVAGPASSQPALGDVVTWEARHFGIRQRLRVRITAASPPHHFSDELVQGRLSHLAARPLFRGRARRHPRARRI